ncbi:unnamed protein product [Gongylonema pulchrum]|uniref:Secreted protein n=1 Tax=Gongylonema pulchrum TaxID=637853 RepID=A0A183D3Y3_9BILA|nr:unnamed protein product [Gongylonema pulchrum]
MVQLKLPFATLASLLLILPESCSIFDPALRRDVSDIPSVMDQRTFLKTRRLKRACLGGMCGGASLLHGIASHAANLISMALPPPPFPEPMFRRRRKRQFGCCMYAPSFTYIK